MKKLLIVLLGLLCVTSFVFAEDDDFDDIFAEAEDVEAPVVSASSASTEKRSPFRLSGSLSTDVGLIVTINEKFIPGGGVSLYNDLYFDIVPNDVFQLHTTIHADIKDDPIFKATAFYFDYLFLGNVFISAGIKGVGWGYTRLFSNSDYYSADETNCGPLITNIMSDSGSFVSCQIRYPWSSGTLTIIPMCPVSAIHANSIGYSDFNYAASVEFTVFHTSLNIFGRIYSGKFETLNPSIGFETKKTILGYDIYGQSVLKMVDCERLNERAGYGYSCNTIGLYRLWDRYDPNIGFNIEYQFVYYFDENLEKQWVHQIAFEGGLKRIGKNKNQKIGLKLHHDIVKGSGSAEFAYLIYGIFPFANWTNAVTVDYAKGVVPTVKIGTLISLDLSY